MDLLEFEGEELYFDQPLDPETEGLLAAAADGYQDSDSDSELPLLRAYFRQPEHPTVLVALYRYFYYQHRYLDALLVAERVLGVFAGRLGIDPDWRALGADEFGRAAAQSMTEARFLLFALKGAGYLDMRLGHLDQAVQRFDKVIELDPVDRIGAVALRELAVEAMGADVEGDGQSATV